MRNLLYRTGVVTAIALASVTMTPNRSGADVPGTAGRINLWDDTSYTDTHYSNDSSDPSFHNNEFNDKASSFVNRTKYFWLLYDDTDYGDRRICLRPFSYHYDLDRVGFNDKASSVKRMTTEAKSCYNWPEVGTKIDRD